MRSEPGTFYVVATPIGNLEDMTHRAVRILGEVDLIAAEDTRAAQVLLQHYSLRRPLVSYHDFNEDERAENLIEQLRAGKSIALISQAGSPGVSDPGYRIVQRCHELGIRVTVVPGPSAVLTALVASGLAVDRFYFAGFPPRTEGKRLEDFARLRTLDATLVFFESPLRLARTLGDLAKALGSRQAAVCRELTKIHEEVVRGSLAELAARYEKTPPKGEVTLVVEGARGTPEEPVDLAEAVRAELARGKGPKEIAAELALRTGSPRRRIYQLALALKGKEKQGADEQAANTPQAGTQDTDRT